MLLEEFLEVDEDGCFPLDVDSEKRFKDLINLHQYSSLSFLNQIANECEIFATKGVSRRDIVISKAKKIGFNLEN